MKAIDSPKALNRAILAQRAMIQAQSLLPLIRMQSETQATAVLYGALCIHYARPFTESFGLGSICESVVPDEYENTHKKLRSHRNQVVAHSDSRCQHNGTSVNSVFFRVTDSGIAVEDRHLSPTAGFLEHIETLLDAVNSQLSQAISDCLNTGPPSQLVLPKGCYQLRADGNWAFDPVDDEWPSD